MNPNPIQFKSIPVVTKPKVKQLSRHSKKMYPQVAEQLNLLIKQAKLKEIENKIGGYP
jgi:hypothetical protein